MGLSDIVPPFGTTEVGGDGTQETTMESGSTSNDSIHGPTLTQKLSGDIFPCLAARAE